MPEAKKPSGKPRTSISASEICACVNATAIISEPTAKMKKFFRRPIPSAS
jgi:hypothetical protein